MVNTILDKFEDWFISAAVLISALILFANVVLRYFFNSGLIWAEELVRCLIVYITFIGGSVCVRRGAHLAVDALVLKLSGRSRAAVDVAVSVTGMAFSLFMAYYGWTLTMTLKTTGQISAGLEMPMYYFYLAMPLGGILMTYRFGQQLAGGIRSAAGRAGGDGR